MMESIYSLNEIGMTYGKGAAAVKAISQVSLEIPAKCFLTITGPSGSGKSTLLNVLGLLAHPTHGSFSFAGMPMDTEDFDELADIRLMKIGFIFQAFNLVPVLDVRENIMVPIMFRSDIPEKEKRERVEKLIEATAITERAHLRPDEISGGQKQRVAVARALVSRPMVVLADEPTANLDSASAESVLQIMRRMNEEFGTAFIFSTHDPRVMRYAKQSIELIDGKVVKAEI